MASNPAPRPRGLEKETEMALNDSLWLWICFEKVNSDVEMEDSMAMQDELPWAAYQEHQVKSWKRLMEGTDGWS
jgi:hypothetical protein